MFATSPTVIATTIVLGLGALLSVGFQLIWLVFAATLFASMFVAVYRTIPRAEL